MQEIRRFFDFIAKIDIKDAEGNPVATQPEVMAFDSGSFYIELLLGSFAFYKIVGAIIDIAFKAIAVWEQHKQSQARIASMTTLVKEMEAIAQYNGAIRTALLEQAVTTLKKSDPFSKAHGEAEAALRAAVQQGMELLEKRMVFLPPASAPTSIKKSFPAPDNIERLFKGDPLKLLEAQTQEADTNKPKLEP